MEAAATGLLTRTLLYAVTISAFGAMALSVGIDPRTALEAMASFMIVFVVARLSQLPIAVAAILPLGIAILVFVYRLRTTGRSRGRLFGRGIGRLLLGLLSAVALAIGVFILGTLLTRIGLASILAEYGTARTVAILLLEAGPLVLGALGVVLLYRANEAGPVEQPGRQQELLAEIGQDAAISGDGSGQEPDDGTPADQTQDREEEPDAD